MVVQSPGYKHTNNDYVDNDYVGMTMLETKVMGTNTQLLPEVNVSTKL